MTGSKTRSAGIRRGLFASLILSILLITVSDSKAQVAGNQVNATLIVQAPYSPYLDQMNKRTIITLTNVSGGDITLAVKGSISNNDRFIRTKEEIYSDHIMIPAGQTKVLNNTNFNFGSFMGRNVVDDNMTDAELNAIYNDRVLPEGNYSYCIQVFQYIDAVYLPVIVNGIPGGEMCSYFSLVFAQPPTLINPFNNSEIDTKGPVNFSWTQPMPVTSARDLRYDLYIVKAAKGEDPRLAMENTFTYQSNYFVKIPDVQANVYTFIPQTNTFKLEPGNTYSVMVQAKDARGRTFFQNEGKSEISTFVYGKAQTEEKVSTTTKTTPAKKSGSADNLATNTIKGKLVWAFRENEDAYRGSKTIFAANMDMKEVQKSAQKGAATSITTTSLSPGGAFGTGLKSYSVSQPGSIYAAYNPLTDNDKNVKNASAKDATIAGNSKLPDFAYSSEPVFNQPQGKKSPGEENVFVYGADKVEYAEDGASKNAAAKRMPLANVKVLVTGIPDDSKSKNQTAGSPANQGTQIAKWLGVSSGNVSASVGGGKVTNAPTATNNKNEEAVKNLIASGTTDGDGNFELHYTNPDYTAIDKYKQVEISWVGDDFINNSMVLSTNVLRNADVDLGEIVAIANTYRFTPTIKVEDASGNTETTKLHIRIYREESDLVNKSYLRWEGNTTPEEKKSVIMSGKKLVPVFEDSVNFSGQAEVKLSRLFYKSRFYIEVSSGPKGLYDEFRTEMVANPVSIAADRVLNVKPVYLIRNAPPFVYGNVKLVDNNISPVGGAVISVEFDSKDVEDSYLTLGSTVISYTSPVGSQDPKTKTVSANQQPNLDVKNNVGISSSPLSFYQSGLTVNAGKATGVPSADANKGGLQVNQSKSVADLLDQTVGPYSTTTDAEGNYFIGNLPRLKPGAKYTVRLIKAGFAFKDMKPDNEAVEVMTMKRGESKLVDFVFHPELFQVVGRVVEADSITPVKNAKMHFSNSTTYFNSGEDGVFHTTYMKGKYSIVIEKEGYLDRTVQVTIEAKKAAPKKEEVKKTGLNISSMWETAASQVSASPTVVASVNRGFAFNAAMFGIAGAQSSSSGSTQTGGSFNEYMGYTLLPGLEATINTLPVDPNLLDIGEIGFLPKRVGKIRFSVLDQSDKPLSGATINVFDTSAVTDANGEWFYEGFGGKATVRITPSEGSPLVAIEESIIITETGVEEVKIFKLTKGIKVSGMVKSDNALVGKAKITVEDKPYLAAESDNDGKYTLYLPAGTFQLKAGKTGYIADKGEVKTVSADIAKDFNLGSGGGKNIAELLGFPIELDQMTPDGNGYKLTGKFVNMQPAIPGLSAKGSVDMRFTDIRVVFDEQNNAIPDGGKVVTDEISIPLKLFGFVPLSFKPQSSSLVVTGKSNGKGQINGILSFDIQSIQGSKGWNLDKAAINLVPKGGSSPEVTVFTSDAINPAGESTFNFLAAAQSAEWKGDIYGFKFAAALKESFIDNSGIHFKGTLNTPDLGPIKKSEFKITDFTIGTDLKVKTVKLDQSVLPAIDIAGWKANIASLLFNENGFKLGGNISVSVPKSGVSNISFSDLSISKDVMYGGKFTLPQQGINIFNIVSMKSGKSALSFGQVAGMPGVYRLAGSGKIKLPKMVTSEIEISAFEVHTNGKLLVDVPTNFSTNLSIMNFELQSIQFNSTAATAFISLQGGLSVDVPYVKMSTGDIRFTPKSGGGSDYTIGKITASLDVPVLKLDVDVSVKDNGFDGKTNLGIPGTPVSAAIDFRYYKVNGGIDLGAKFVAGVQIPVGIIMIEKVGGGFQYNTASKEFAVNINGALSVTGTGVAAKLDPVGLTVRSGPVIEGYGDVVVGTIFNMAKAKIYLDFPHRKFAVNIKTNYSPIAGLSTTQIQGDLIISGTKGDSYVFLGCNINANLAGLVNANGEYVLGQGIQNPMSRGDAISYYFRNASESYIGNEFTGAYINTVAKMGRPQRDPFTFDLSIASAKFWYNADANANLVVNYANKNYVLNLNGNFGGGFKFCVGYKSLSACAGLGYNACFNFTGGRDNRGWFVDGDANGNVELKIGGCDPSCDSIDWGLCGIGGKLCTSAGARVNYTQASGLSLSFVKGGTVTCP